MTKREIAGTIADASLPRTPLKIRGKEYNLCFDLGALSEAETAINAEYARARLPERVNLLVSLSDLNLTNTRILFAAAIRAFHPEISFREAQEIPALGDLFELIRMLGKAWEESTANPREPEREPEGEPAGVAAGD